ncbi:MAG: cold-shock protein [Dolichospermum sp.]|jgi:cold shock CspA family protein
METGTIILVDHSSESGYITPDNTNENIYFRYAHISTNSFSTFATGKKVSYTRKQIEGSQGYEAVNIVVNE